MSGQFFKPKAKDSKSPKKDDTMKKSQYDADGDGVVDNAKKIDGKSLEFLADRSNHTGSISADNVEDGQYKVAYSLEEKNKLNTVKEGADKTPSADQILESLKKLPGFNDVLQDIVAQAKEIAAKNKPVSMGNILAEIKSKGLLFLTEMERLKLDGVEKYAQKNPSGSDIKSMYESNADTNAFTDKEKEKLSKITQVGEKNPTATEIKKSYEGLSDTNAFTDAEKEKLSKIAPNADVSPKGADKISYKAIDEKAYIHKVKDVEAALNELVTRLVISERRYLPVGTVLETAVKKGEVVTEGSDWVSVVRLVAKDMPKGKYSVIASSSIRGQGSKGTQVQARASLNNVDNFADMEWSPNPSDKMSFSGHDLYELEGNATFDVFIRVIGLGKAYASNTKILLRREG